MAPSAGTITNLIDTDLQVVRIRNAGKKEFVGKYANRKYIVQPGNDTIIPFEAMCLWFGHPNAIDLDKRRKFRTDEFNRLCVRYGVYEHHDKFKEQTPDIEVYDLATGNRIITVMDDPDGKHLTPETQTIADRELMAQQMVAMQRQMAAMQAQMQEMDAERAAQVQGGDTRTDTSESKPELKGGVSPVVVEDDEDTSGGLPPEDGPHKPKAVAANRS